MSSHGILLLNKRSGFTSFDELRCLKKYTQLKKIGHAGTLDKFAQGMLIVLVGYMTKFTQYFVSLEKEYQARFFFGEETSTLDPEGEVMHRGEIPQRQQVSGVLDQFIGKISQIPPEYSAVHINGKRAYQLARSGKHVDMPQRRVVIRSLELLDWQPPEADFRITCSKGTYIRSLARDIAVAAGTRGYVSGLTRNSVGPFHIDQGVASPEVNLPVHLIPPEEAVSMAFSLDVARILPEHELKLKNGVKPSEAWLTYCRRSCGDSGFLMVTDGANQPIGWYHREGDSLKTVHIPTETGL